MAETKIFTYNNRLESYRKLLEIEENSNRIIAIQDFPLALFRNSEMDKKRAKMRFRDKEKQNEYLEIINRRRNNFHKKASNGAIITHIYNRQCVRLYAEKGDVADNLYALTCEERRFIIRELINCLINYPKFTVRLASERSGIQAFCALDNNKILFQQPGEHHLEAKYWDDNEFKDEFYKFAQNLAENESIDLEAKIDTAGNLVSEERKNKKRLIRWLRLLLKDDWEHSPIEELKNILTGSFKNLLIDALRLENIKARDIKLFYFGYNSELIPHTLNLLMFEPADFLEIYDSLPYFGINDERRVKVEPLYKSGYVNDVLGFKPDDEHAESAQVYSDDNGAWVYTPDARTTGYSNIDSILGLYSTLYIPLKIDSHGGVLMISITNRYFGESRFAKDSKLNNSISLFHEKEGLGKLKEFIENTFYSNEFNRYKKTLSHTLGTYIHYYNRVVRRFEFALIKSHLDIDLEEKENIVAKHINEKVFENILRFNNSNESIREKYLKANCLFYKYISQLDAYEKPMMLTKEAYRNHTAHMFNVLCMGNILLTCKTIKNCCNEYMKNVFELGDNPESIEKAINLIKEHFWENNQYSKEDGKLFKYIFKDLNYDLDKLVVLIWYVIATNHDIARALEDIKSNGIESLKLFNILDDTKDELGKSLKEKVKEEKKSLINDWSDTVWFPSYHIEGDIKKSGDHLFPFNSRTLEDYLEPDILVYDHAHLGAFSVWKSLKKIMEARVIDPTDRLMFQKLILVCTWPILYHHLLTAKEKNLSGNYEDLSFSFNKFPFLGLLIIADSIQMWGRKSAVKDEARTFDTEYDYNLHLPLISKLHISEAEINIRFDFREHREDPGVIAEQNKHKENLEKSMSLLKNTVLFNGIDLNISFNISDDTLL